jgi:hypothetical protein
MTDVDQILRDHAADATVEPAPDGWERLVARLDELPSAVVPIDDRPRRDRRSSRWALVGAAAVVAVVLAGGAVALTRSSGGAEERPAATEPGPIDGEPVPDPSSHRPEVDPATMPDRIVAVVDQDGDGLPDIVRIDDLRPFDDDRPEPVVLVTGASVAPDRITSVEVSPDGGVLYGVEVGDEDHVRRAHVAGGVDMGTQAVGRQPATTADGRLIATVTDDQRVHVLDTVAREDTIYGRPADGEEVTSVSISPDGTWLARERVTRHADGTIDDVAVDVTPVDEPVGWEEVERSSGAGLPTFMPDGHLALGLGTWDASEGHDEVHASEVGMLDLATGEVRWSVGGGGFSFTYFDASPDGRWVIVGDDGIVRAFAAVDGWLWDSGTVAGGEGLVDASW